jgi:hypothetical protein
MHYNPASIQLAKETIESLGEANQLGSVVVEACDVRWNKTAELYAEKPFLKKILNNETRTACETALAFNRPVVLGDQKINVTVDALKASFKQTIQDLLTPPTGWKRFIEEVQVSWEDTVPFGGDGYLSAFAFLHPRLLLVLPVSLVKYPLLSVSSSIHCRILREIRYPRALASPSWERFLSWTTLLPWKH